MTNRRLAEFILRRLNRRRMQPIWERLHAVCLNGMGFGAPTLTLADSGELAALKDVVRRIQAKYGEPLTCFDVGANAGQYALLLAETMPAGSIVHSFEPSAVAYERLVANCRNLPQVHPHHLALGAQPGTATLYAARAGDVTGSTLPSSKAGVSVETASMETLDGTCDRLGIEIVHYLKIDTEGTELDVLRGAKKLLQRGAIKAVQWEFGQQSLQAGARLTDFVQLLAGFQIYRVVGDGLYPLRYTPRMEIFHSCANYIALQ